MQKFLGTGVALITPFKTDNTVDFDALEKLVDYQIDNDVDYIVVLGTTAETATLTVDEQEAVERKIIEVTNNRVPLVLGLGGNNTASLIDTLKTKDFSNYSAILSVSPYYNKPTQEGIYQHFKAISLASPLPVILYNVPSRTGVNMDPKTVIRLANDFDNVIGIKEAAGDMDQANELIKNCPKDFLIISGDDMIALPMTLAGGAGVISVIGQAYPKDFSRMIQLGLQNKEEEGYVIHNKVVDVIDYIFEEGNPVGIKSLLSSMGFGNDFVRLPLVSATKPLKEKLIDYVNAY